MNLGGTFDPATVPPSEPYEPLPTGWYPMQAVSSEIKDSKEKPGNRYLEFVFEMVESMRPDLKGKKVFARLNIWNQTPKASEIAQRELSAICRAAGVGAISDSEHLHGKPVAVKVQYVDAKDGYEPKNEVKGYDSIAARFGGTGSSGAGVAAPTQPSAPAMSAQPPWKKS